MEAIKARDDLQLQVACAGTMLLDRFKTVAHQVRADGFTVNAEFLCELEGSTSYSQAASACLAGYNFATTLYQIDPDCLLVIGDRYETGGCAYAAHQMNIPICHLQGGEVSGTRDDGTRNMITQLATWHVPATDSAASAIAAMRHGANPLICAAGERDGYSLWSVVRGCPSSDLAAKLTPRPNGDILACFHPNTDHPETSAAEAAEFADALQLLASEGKQIVLLWPNIDAGSGSIVKELRWINNPRIELHKNFPPDEFMQRLADCAVAVGNSSSFCRDSSFFGTPVVLVGDRQQGREHAQNVMHCEAKRVDILAAAVAQLLHGRYEPSTLYGDGKVSQRIADGLARVLNAKMEVAA